MVELREYQKDIVNKGTAILEKKRLLYLAMQVRTGKTLTSLSIANNFECKHVLFITKKKAISSIENDYELLNPNFKLTIINNESLHKVTGDFDLIIVDESHRISSFPKPNKTAKDINQRYRTKPMILLSGTPATESSSQWYHSFWISHYSPFRQYKNFYSWAKDFVKVKKKYLGYAEVNDYSDGLTDKIQQTIKEYVISFTQSEAGFTSTITENIIFCDITDGQKMMIERLKKHGIIQGITDIIIADTGAKMMQKIHQISNGTIILDSGNSIILSNYKAKIIKEKFEGKKIAIFYYYKKELELLLDIFGENITTDLDVFNTTDKCICLQQCTGSEGISLKKAECIVYYSFGFSGKNYVQGRERMQTIDRENNNVYFVFAKNSIDEKIYNVIKNKKTYTEKLFRYDFGAKNTK